MKSFASFVAGFLSALVFTASAATITLSTTAGQDARLVAAFTAKLQPGCPDACRNATAADIKAWIISELTAVVQNYEYQQQQATITTQPIGGM